ncbi:hypothetical protein [Glycomyces xiaoerkulensis]|uniref:hypothetical protein n=1 Tax=Glycomyces xiaoerkulensis TaxID=2038139 RepID=UPI000C25816E|nr:hypothetical protein [Glycomyces xiaoerkulensis]
MSVVDGIKDGLKSALGTGWAVAKKLAVKLAIAALIVAVVVVIVERGEGSAAEPVDDSGSHSASVRPAILSTEAAGEQLLLCRYEVDAIFGVSVFTEKEWTSGRLVRLYHDEEVRGSCFAREGGKALSCEGLAWDYEWIRVRSGTTVGWSPASCFERIGFL